MIKKIHLKLNTFNWEESGKKQKSTFKTKEIIKTQNVLRFLSKRILPIIFFILISCGRGSESNKSETKDVFLPTEKQINQVLRSKGDYRMLDDYAKSKGYKNVKEYHSKLLSELDDKEFQNYYDKYKPSGMENLGVEAVANERKKIQNRIVWYKIVQEVNLKIELKTLDMAKIDWKNIPLDEEPSIGNQFAKVTVIEFSDFQCHFCSKSQSASSAIREKYGKKIFWVFKDYPLQEIHEDAFQAHVSANCVNEIAPDKYWSHFKTLFENYRNLEKENLISYVKKNGIDTAKWESCMGNKELQKKIISEIQADIKEGRKLGIAGTPTFIINGNVIVGARGYEFFDAVIEKELKE